MPRGDSDATRAARDAARAYAQALGLTGQPDVIPEPGRADGFHSSPPWNAAAANVATGIHRAARRIEAGLRGRDTRGGSDRNTIAALESISRLAEAAPPGDVDAAVEQLRDLADAGAALPAVDEADAWRPLPRQPGQPPPRCPYCRSYSLRWLRGKLLVACRKPSCRDGDGNRPVAAVDRSTMLDGAPALAWSDGLVT
jgi:hypothetical protein